MAQGFGSSAGEAEQHGSLTPEQAQKLQDLADAQAAAFGRLCAKLLISTRHAQMTLAEVNTYVSPAVGLGQFALVAAQSQPGGASGIAAAAWWALVSPEVDERLTASQDPFLRLEAHEWNGGEQPWIIDTIGHYEFVGELLKRLSEHTFKGKSIKLRAARPDGRMAVRRIDARPPHGEQTKS